LLAVCSDAVMKCREAHPLFCVGCSCFADAHVTAGKLTPTNHSRFPRSPLNKSFSVCLTY